VPISGIMLYNFFHKRLTDEINILSRIFVQIILKTDGSINSRGFRASWDTDQLAGTPLQILRHFFRKFYMSDKIFGIIFYH
jgi:hypothetical protein